MLLHGLGLVLLVALAQLALCAEDFYKVLGVEKDATERQLKSAYRQLSKSSTRIRTRATRRHTKSSSRYPRRTRSCPTRRRGTSTTRAGTRASSSTSRAAGARAGTTTRSTSSRASSAGTGTLGTRTASRAEHNVEVRVEISLRDFYNGATTEFKWERQQICETCEGSGSADGEVEACGVCGSHGVRIVKQQLAPGMYQQMQMRCDACGGRGKTIRNKCPTCGGARVERKHNTVTLKVERGAARDSRVVYENEADASPDWVAGDLIVNLSEKDPSEDDNPDGLDGVYFRRKGDDLFWTEVLSLREAWMGGWSRNLTHLDAHVVRLGRPRGESVQPGHVRDGQGRGHAPLARGRRERIPHHRVWQPLRHLRGRAARPDGRRHARRLCRPVGQVARQERRRPAARQRQARRAPVRDEL
ncbi:hypothetical protein ACCO45_000167 [Purpureocillium lilacinum]|uniref:Uncharacterized protein n=1 Tax=Purpureocillium lilacinum TaxID=33203 RepID=A0ACC4E4A1_PURLI